jgi:formylglycine-generating enzyme required for sulfatase activity
MGSDPTQDGQALDDEQPQHTVMLPAYQIAAYPVTVAEYACFVRTGHEQPHDWRRQLGTLDHPVVSISWHDAVAYADWLAQLTGQPWRIPSEAEWEKAARGTDGRIYPWGHHWDTHRCNTAASGIGTSTAIGAFADKGDASPCGAHDLAGNVWEWTSSLRKPYPYTVQDGRETQYGADNRVLRGGSWGLSPRFARPAYRIVGGTGNVGPGYGFRLVRASPGSV